MVTLAIFAPVVLLRTHSAFTSPTKRAFPTMSRPSGPEVSLLTVHTPERVLQPGSGTGFALVVPTVELQPANDCLNCETPPVLRLTTSTALLVRSVTE